MRADLRKHCISRSSMPSACHLSSTNVQQAGRHEDTWLGLARGPRALPECGWRAVLARCGAPANLVVTSGTIAMPLGLRGLCLLRCCAGTACQCLLGFRYLSAPSARADRKVDNALKGFAHVPESNQKPSAAAAIGGSRSTAQARVDQRKGGTLRRCTNHGHGIGSDIRGGRAGGPSASRSRRSGDHIVRCISRNHWAGLVGTAREGDG